MADPLRQTYGEVFFLTNGLQRDPYGLANFHPASNVNRLDVYLEDGVSTNVVMVNFRADGKNFPTSVFFPTLYGGTVQKVITGEATARTFAKYSLLVPPQVLQWNANGSAPLGLTATVVQTAGDGLLGAFATYTELTTTHTATQILYDDGAIAYVYSTEGVNEYGFYMVSYDSGTDTYSWVEVDNPVTQINMVDTKQYNIVGMQIQKGNLPSPTHGVTISDAYIRYILAYLAQINDIALANQTAIGDSSTSGSIIFRLDVIEADIDAIIAGTQNITYDPTISGLVATTIKGAIDEIVARLVVDELAITNLQTDKEDKANKVTAFQVTPTDVAYPSEKLVKDSLDTKEALANKATDFSIKNDTLYPSVQAVDTEMDVKVQAHNVSNLSHADIRALIAGLQGAFVYRGYITVYAGDEPTPTELTDRLTVLMSRAPITGDVLIDNSEIEWYFDGSIWNNMGQAIIALASALNDGLMSSALFTKLTDLPTMSALTTLLFGKVDKVADSSLVLDTLIAKLDELDTQAQTDAKLDLKLDKDISTLELYNIVDTDLFFKRSASGALQRVTAQQAKDYFVSAGLTFDATVNYMTNGLGAFKSAVTMIHPVTLQTNGDFRCSIKAIETNTFIYVLFPTITATNTLRVSTDNGTTYYNVLKNGSTMRASIVSGQLVRLQFDGTQFIADIQNDVAVTETYGETIESTYGLFNPQFEGIPLVKEIQGFTLSAPQLVTNGDFSTDLTNWVTTTTVWTPSWESGTYKGTWLNVTLNGYSENTGVIATIGQKYYGSCIFKSSKANVLFGVRLGVAPTTSTYNVTLGTYQFHSVIQTASDVNPFRIFTNNTNYVNGDTFNFDNVIFINLSTLISNKQYSPMFNTTFDLMTDANIKLQMDAWVQEGVLPYDGVQHVENTQLKSVGVNQFNRASWVTSYGYKIPVKASTVYTWSENIAYKLYDAQENEVASGTASTVTTTSTARYIAFNTITNTSTFMLVEGATLPSTYLSHITETQKFNHGRLSRLPNGVHDKIRYNNGAWVLDRYIGENTNVGIGAVINTTTLPTIKTTGTFMAIDNTTKALQYGSYGDTLTLSNASTVYFELATMTTSTLDVDGVLLQDTVTTVQQLQDLPTTYLLEYAMNTDQTTATLVQRDKVQQLEIDSLETRTTALEARKETNKEIIFMSATDWATYTRVDGEVYGVWDETTGVITFYYGVVGV